MKPIDEYSRNIYTFLEKTRYSDALMMLEEFAKVYAPDKVVMVKAHKAELADIIGNELSIGETPDSRERKKKLLLILLKLNEAIRKDAAKNDPSSSENSGESSSLIDPRYGQRYKTVEINGQIWMAENLNYELTNSWYYGNDPKYEKEYGRLYTWEAAMKACPPEWRLPTDEECHGLIDYYGDEYAAYKHLIKGGRSGFNALLGGYRNSGGNFGSLGSNGGYWSGTEEGADFAWSYYFYSGYGRLSRGSLLKSGGHSCRCLKD